MNAGICLMVVITLFVACSGLRNFRIINRFDLCMCRNADPEIYKIKVDKPNEKLDEVVAKHCSNYRTYCNHNKIAQHTIKAFDQATAFVDDFYDVTNDYEKNGKVVILDSGCGKGLSTLILAKLYPDIPIIGIDRSHDRLSRFGVYSTDGENNDEQILVDSFVSFKGKSNAILIRAELSDFWSLVGYQSDWVVKSHYILYPNPYPKAKHLKRRFHGHPIFPTILALGGNLIVRSNWDIYCKEMLTGIQIAFRGNQSIFPPWYKYSSLYMEKYHYNYELTDDKVSRGTYDIINRINDPMENLIRQNDLVVKNENGANVPMTHFERKYMAIGLDIYNTVASFTTITPEQRKSLLSEMMQATK